MHSYMISILGLLAGSLVATGQSEVKSPDGQLSVTVRLADGGVPVYQIQRGGKVVLGESKLGLVREDADFSKGLKMLAAVPAETVEDLYELAGSKRLVNRYQASRQVLHLEREGGGKLDIIFQVSNDGVAFRYHFPEADPAVRVLKEERTSFHFLPETKAWLQPASVAKTGYCHTNPSYEEYYEMDIPVGKPSTLAAGWVFPALFRTGDTWLFVSETGLGRSYCGSRLRDDSTGGEYQIGYPDPRETAFGQDANPHSSLPWTTPWRVIAVGSLKTVVESTLGTDLADAPKHPAKVEPGKASWSWVMLKDDYTKYETQKQFIDYAADMGWGNCLIDAEWDTQIGYDKVKELCAYGATKAVKVHVWYNSNGNWNGAQQSPRNRLSTKESRLAEFKRLKEMGVAGLKIDFFGGDGQPMIGHYLDLLEDAEPFGFIMNFHGCTLPRGWQRTYPHLVTMEAIRGMEFVTFEQENADRAPEHMAMLPFTRNVFDPMDFTPVSLGVIPKIQRRTSSAFELATGVLYVSGVQHYAEIPEVMAKMPDYVKALMKEIPSVWQDSKFLMGEPGKYVVMARKGGGKWYLAGINAGAEAKALKLDMGELGKIGGSGVLVTDGDGGFRKEEVVMGKEVEVTVQPKGGFVLVVQAP